MPTRRQFIRNCSAVAITASVAPVTAFGAPVWFKEVSLQLLGLSAFSAHLNTNFQVQIDSSAVVVLQLVDVRSTAPFPGEQANAEDSRYEKFSLLFRGALEQPIEQDSYWFQHQAIGRFAIFIVPVISAETTRRYYEAIFNRPPYGRLPRAGEGKIPRGSPRNWRNRSEQESLR